MNANNDQVMEEGWTPAELREAKQRLKDVRRYLKNMRIDPADQQLEARDKVNE